MNEKNEVFGMRHIFIEYTFQIATSLQSETEGLACISKKKKSQT